MEKAGVMAWPAMWVCQRYHRNHVVCPGSVASWTATSSFAALSSCSTSYEEETGNFLVLGCAEGCNLARSYRRWKFRCGAVNYVGKFYCMRERIRAGN